MPSYLKIWVWPIPGTAVLEKKFWLELYGSCRTVKELKEELGQVGGLASDRPDCIAVRDMTLVFGGQVLEDEKLLADYGVVRNRLPPIILVIRRSVDLIRRVPRRRMPASFGCPGCATGK